MSNVHSDLEEGEIIDDSPSTLPAPNIKKLPRRYIFKENKNRHKKDCKHAIRHQAKKLSKLKNIPVKRELVHNTHQSCVRVHSVKKNNKIRKHAVIPPKSFHSKKQHSPSLMERNCPYIERAKLKSTLNLNDIRSENFRSSCDAVKKIESCSFAEISSMYKTLQSEKVKSEPSLKEKIDVGAQISESNPVGVHKTANTMIPKPDQARKEDSEDEEELRRIALSTCVTNVPKQQNHNSCPNLALADNLASNSLNNFSHVPNYVNMMGADNNEVVDMELDEDCVKSDISEDIFVIDTKPSLDTQKNSDTASKENISSDDDFEVDILRAELIENMYRQKSSGDENQSDNKHVKTNSIPENTLRNNDKILPQNTETKLIENGNRTETNKTEKRLIISLNADSSSDSSEDDAHSSSQVFPENHVASIEALISDMRQKSDSNDKSDNCKQVPKAVSCLSKAQQEEYNSLMKILAKKKKPPSTQGEESKNKSVHSPMNDLKILEKKLVGVTETLKKKKELLNHLLLEVAEHKKMYMKSKLTAQLLKEQYVAAEKVRRVKLQAWSKSCKKFDALKMSVSELESKTSHLKNLCSRIGSCINGLNYSLPSLSAES